MRRILTVMVTVFVMAFVIMVMWEHETVAQPVYYGIQAVPTLRPIRSKGLKDKYYYAEEAKNRWAILKSHLEEGVQGKDPFGANLDPGELSYVPEKPRELPRNEPKYYVTEGPLQEAVNKFKPNVISVAEQLVMVGPRPVRVGDLVQIKHEDELFNLRLEKIAANELEFINTRNQERAIKVVSMQQAVDRFQPNVISVTKQMVMVGSRSLRVGNDVQIDHEGVLFKLRIVRISANEVEFINPENQEKAIARQNGFDPSGLKEKASDILKRISDDGSTLILK